MTRLIPLVAFLAVMLTPVPTIAGNGTVPPAPPPEYNPPIPTLIPTPQPPKSYHIYLPELKG
jgi:hypothetical protein